MLILFLPGQPANRGAHRPNTKLRLARGFRTAGAKTVTKHVEPAMAHPSRIAYYAKMASKCWTSGRTAETLARMNVFRTRRARTRSGQLCQNAQWNVVEAFSSAPVNSSTCTPASTRMSQKKLSGVIRSAAVSPCNALRALRRVLLIARVESRPGPSFRGVLIPT